MGAIMADAHRRMHIFFEIFGGFFGVSALGLPTRRP
jgi:hypothetical protein